MPQLELPIAESDLSNLTRFERFLLMYAQHADLFDLFKRFAWTAKQAGCERYGARAIVEQIRWHKRIEAGMGDWKINDLVIPYLSRLLMLRQPEYFAGFFERRDAHFDVDDETLLAKCNRIDRERSDTIPF